MKTRIRSAFLKYRFHLIWWSAFIGYEVLVIGFVAGKFGGLLNYVSHYTVNIILFYIHFGLVLPFSFKKSTYARIMLVWLILAELLLYMFISLLIGACLKGIFSIDKFNPGYRYNMASLFRGIYFLGFSTGYFFIRKYIIERTNREDMEKKELAVELASVRIREELKEARYAYLKAQINPHFLFNTLNFIYVRIRKKNAESAQAIIALRDMMEYAIQSENLYPKIELMEEIKQLEKLIFLYKLIKNGKAYIKIEYNEQIFSSKFIPLVLLTLVENIFKHGDLSNPNQSALISFVHNESGISITTRNLINNCRNLSGGGIGLSNIEERLKEAYGSRVRFIYGKEEQHYLTSIEIENDNSIT